MTDQPTAPTPAPLNSSAVAALALGFIALVGPPLTFAGLAVLLGLPAVVLGLRGRRQTRTSGERGRGLATAGLLLGAAAVGLFVVGFALFALFPA